MERLCLILPWGARAPSHGAAPDAPSKDATSTITTTGKTAAAQRAMRSKV